LHPDYHEQAEERRQYLGKRMDEAPLRLGHRAHQNRHAHVRIGSVARRSADKRQYDRQQDRHRLGPRRGAIEDVAGENPHGITAEISTRADPETTTQSQ
jgi:hypothetical protein